ncbi:MAG: pseudouridine synthase [Cyanobacteria bacterium P01_A01_bin.135]
MAERLQKLLSQWGIASRRKAEQLIREGRVRVNGQVAHLGQSADPAQDQIWVDGRAIAPQTRPDLQYFLMHKPKGVLSTCRDPQGRRTVVTLLPKAAQSLGLHPVGRLDAASTGALLLTNDGDLTFQLTHPRHHIHKTYRVTLDKAISDAALTQWQQGVVLDGRPTLPAKVTLINATSQKALLEVVLWEGRNRQIRRVAEQLGYRVTALHRTAIGELRLGKLAVGQCRQLGRGELALLRSRSLPSQAVALKARTNRREQ